MVRDEFAEIQFSTRVIDVDSDQIALGVVIQNNAFRDLLALDAGPVGQIDVKLIGIWKIIQFHRRNLRSRNAFCMFIGKRDDPQEAALLTKSGACETHLIHP